MRNSWIPFVLAFLVASCGGGGGSNTPRPSSISGTAATGAPLANAGVEVKCLQGSASGTTDATGKFTLSVTGAQAPCLLKASGQGVELVSVFAASDGTANITSLTHLLTAQLLRAGSPAAAFSAGGAATFAAVTEQGISAAQGTVANELLRIGSQMPSVNWITQPFTAAQGDAMDAALVLLKTKLATQNKTLDGAATELAAGPLQVAVPPEAITCVPGMIAGFDKSVQDDILTRVISQPSSGGGDGPGGVGAGDGSGDGGAGGVGAGGSLGQFVNVDVTVQFASGVAFGPTRVDSANGMVTIVPCQLQPPVLVTFSGAAASGARYFDEQLGQPVSFEGQTLRGILTRLDRNGGVTPFTDAMVRRTLLLGDQVATDGGHRLKALEKAEDAWKDPARVQIAHDEVLKAVNDLLPGIYRLEDLRRLPVIVNATKSAPDSAALTDNQNGVYGAVLAGFAKAAGSIQPASSKPALDIQTQFANDLVDGVRDLRSSGGTPVAAGKGAATYGYDSLASKLTTETAAVAKTLGSGGLKSRITPLQRLKAMGGRTFAPTAPNWTFTLQSDSTLSMVRNGEGGSATVAPALPPGTRIGKIFVFDRSTRTLSLGPDDDYSLPVDWQNCLIAISVDGQRIFSWRVGIPQAAFDQSPAGVVPDDPIVTVAPESLSANQFGGDSIMLVRRSGAIATTTGCDQQDFHPNMPNDDERFPGKYVVQVQQDFGNRYLVFSDGTVNAWGINRGALGVGLTGDGTLGASESRPLATPASNNAAGDPNPLIGVVMVSRGDGIQQTRALVRSPDPASDGTVYVWGEGLPRPRQIPGLTGVCWIQGPYAVKCNGDLFFVEVTASGGNLVPLPQIVKVDVEPIWRVSADFPTTRDTGSVNPNVEVVELRQQRLSHSAIAVDGSIYRLTDDMAPAEQ